MTSAVNANGDTWSLSSSNNGQTWTKQFVNALGQAYKTQQSGFGGTVVTATTLFDANGRPDQYTDFDGTVTHTDYDPGTGQVMDTWQDNNADGVFSVAKDTRTLDTPSPITTTDGNWAGDVSTGQSTSGVQTDTVYQKNSGLDSEQIVNGETTTSHTTLGSASSPGNDVVTTTHSDGTQTRTTYVDGLLQKVEQLGSDGSTVITTVTYGYDALRRNVSVKDWRGTTKFVLRPDGSVQETDYPDGRKQVVTSFDLKTQAPTTVTRTDTQSVGDSLNSRGSSRPRAGRACCRPASPTPGTPTGI